MFTMTFFLINLTLKLRGLPYSVWHEGTDAQWTFVTANFQCVAPALLIHMSMIWINVMSCVGLASGWRPSCMARNLTLDITCKLFNQFFHTCHAYKHHWLQPFYSPFTNLDIAWRSKDQCKENLMASFSRTLFNWSGWNFIWCWSKSSWTSWYYFWATFKGTREITAVLWTVSKTFKVGMLSDVYEWIWFATWCDDRYCCALHVDTSLTDLDLDSISQGCDKAKISAPINLTKFSIDLNGRWFADETCLCDETLTHLFCPFHIHWRKLY